jgi:endonuclease-3
MAKTKTTQQEIPNPRLPEIIEALQAEYPDAHCELSYRNAFQLLIATILSAQCTDIRVNIVTADLFKKYRKPQDYLDVSLEVLEEDIRSTGFYRNKARNIRNACETLVNEHRGRVPKTMDQLIKLGGVGRKTANVVLGNIWNTPDGVVVDTHVSRITQKLGLTAGGSAEKIERDLNQIVPEEHWTMFPHWLIFHGRRVCNARKPKCDNCALYEFCYERA